MSAGAAKQLAVIEGPRVRFAPAPTGFLHIGGARTVLFNWLFARKYNGSFILRVEDTDKERSRPEFEKDITDNLRWLGLEWDEGIEVGGKFGPYRQSERLASYQQHLEKLLQTGMAYYCFCSEEDLAAERQEMLSRGVAPKYSGRCRTLPVETVEEYRSQRRSSVIRFKMPETKVVFEDLVHGTISFDSSLFGDIPVARDLTSPLYNFAVVIDDFEMKINHVIRGDEHISNTPKQILLQQALGFPQPIYAHLPLILGEDRAKLSKRHGMAPVRDYRQSGYLPEALLNFIALLGWHPAGDREIFSLQGLIEEFSMERVQKAPAIFNPSRLAWINSYYLKHKSLQDLLPDALPFWKDAGFIEESENTQFKNSQTKALVSITFLQEILNLAKERLEELSDLADLTEFFFRQPQYEPELLCWKEMTLSEVREALEKIMEAISSIEDEEFTSEKIDSSLSGLYADDKGSILWPLRVSLTGRKASPGPLEIAAILGKKETLRRLEYALKLL